MLCSSDGVFTAPPRPHTAWESIQSHTDCHSDCHWHFNQSRPNLERKKLHPRDKLHIFPLSPWVEKSKWGFEVREVGLEWLLSKLSCLLVRKYSPPLLRLFFVVVGIFTFTWWIYKSPRVQFDLSVPAKIGTKSSSCKLESLRFFYIFSCPEQLNRWPCHSLTDWLTQGTLLIDI